MYAHASAQRGSSRKLQRALVVDPQPATSRLLGELLKDLGIRRVVVEATASRGFEVARLDEPEIVFTEFSGPELNGPDFVRRLRRSEFACRQVPVVMVTSEATAAAIIAARDSGVHEFLRKPFTIKDLTKRIDAVTLRSRDWVEGVRYIGPDRRRFNSADYRGPRKRKSDAAHAGADAGRVEQALRIVRACLEAIETDPSQVYRSLIAQAAELTRAAVAGGDLDLTTDAASLQKALTLSGGPAGLSRPMLQAVCGPLIARLPAEAA